MQDIQISTPGQKKTNSEQHTERTALRNTTVSSAKESPEQQRVKTACGILKLSTPEPEKQPQSYLTCCTLRVVRVGRSRGTSAARAVAHLAQQGVSRAHTWRTPPAAEPLSRNYTQLAGNKWA